MTVTSFAQQAVYYALDGSEWVSEANRDAQEIILWETFSDNIKYMKVNDLCTSDYFDTFSEMFELYKSAISDLSLIHISTMAVTTSSPLSKRPISISVPAIVTVQPLASASAAPEA